MVIHHFKIPIGGKQVIVIAADNNTIIQNPITSIITPGIVRIGSVELAFMINVQMLNAHRHTIINAIHIGSCPLIVQDELLLRYQ